MGQPRDFKNGPIVLKFGILLSWVIILRRFFHFSKNLIFGLKYSGVFCTREWILALFLWRKSLFIIKIDSWLYPLFGHLLNVFLTSFCLRFNNKWAADGVRQIPNHCSLPTCKKSWLLTTNRVFVCKFIRLIVLIWTLEYWLVLFTDSQTVTFIFWIIDLHRLEHQIHWKSEWH